jgi:RNA polymerase sigma-70 factor (ECF subfamily)
MTAAGGPGGPPTRPVGTPADHEGRGDAVVRASGGIGPPEAEIPGGGSLLERLRAGDRKAMGRLVGLHADALYGFISHRLDSPERVDDLVQEVFLAAWRALPEFRGDSQIRTWLLGIARHKIGDYYRARLRDLSADGVDEENPPAGLKLVPRLDEKLDQQKRSDRIRQVLSRLPDRYRAVLMWRYWDQRSLAEMAQITGNTEKAIERLLDRARRLFRKWWTDD